ncbi:MAG: gfo/Idh/MocA family oxidoreductase [Ferruginibacter sp.]|nr:gfo/Idh/MocA family oxidoreductase [Ferruginibacter sp.]
MKNEKPASTTRRDFVTTSAKALTAFLIIPRYVLGGKRPDGSSYVPPSDMISLGFIGTGKQGRGLTGSFLKTGQVRIVALSEVYKDKAQLTINAMKELHGTNPVLGKYSEMPVYNDFRELLARKDLDAVVIATPDHWHAAMAVRAAEAGKDIYCEKPLSLTIKEGRAMVNATRKHNRVFQTGSMQRSWPEFRQAVELIRNGHIGEIKNIKVNVGQPPIPYNLAEEPIPAGLDWSRWLGPNDSSVFNSELAPPTSKDVYPNWRNYREFGGGMVTDWGAHMFDIVQWALNMDNSGPVEVIAPDGKEHPFLTYRYENGILMTHEKWEWDNAIHFIGTTGEIKLKRRKIETTPVGLSEKIIGDTEQHVYKSEDHYKDFLNAMRNRTKPVCDVETGHRTASVCNIGNIAFRLKRPLQWDPVLEQFKNDKEANALLGRPMHNKWKIKI